MYSALDIAKYFITLASPEQEDFITNLKLQKLLYYAQGFYLAMFDKPLFTEKIEAWQYGPVVPDIYHHYKQYKLAFIPQPEDFNPEQYDQETQDLLNEVYEVYGQYTAPALMHLTHQELPWKKTTITEEISHSLMKTYFESQLVK
ncbi:MAG: SocA family protein [Symploca sp. SIO1A3]|nr:SocA family protein [Symploca sp. SIO1A3]